MGNTSLAVLLGVNPNDAAAARQQRKCQQGLQSQHCMGRTWKRTFSGKGTVLTSLRSELERSEISFSVAILKLYKFWGRGGKINK